MNYNDEKNKKNSLKFLILFYIVIIIIFGLYGIFVLKKDLFINNNVSNDSNKNSSLIILDTTTKKSDTNSTTLKKTSSSKNKNANSTTLKKTSSSKNNNVNSTNKTESKTTSTKANSSKTNSTTTYVETTKSNYDEDVNDSSSEEDDFEEDEEEIIITTTTTKKATTTTTTTTKSTTTKSQKVKVNVSKVSLNKSSANVNINETLNVTVTISPSDATNKNIKWTSSDNSIATVDSSGMIKGIKAGKVTISAISADNSSKKATMTVTIKKVSVSSITSNKDKIVVDVKNTMKVTPIVLPSNSTEKTIKYSTKDKSIATVDSSGNVKGVKAGTTSLTMSIDGKSQVIKVYVVPVGDKIHFIDIEDNDLKCGDAILIETTDSKGNKIYGMIDIGHYKKINRVIKYLQDLNITKLNWIVFTHIHADHTASSNVNKIGIEKILKSGIKIDNIYMKDYIGLDSNMKNGESVQEFRDTRMKTYNKFKEVINNYKIPFNYITKTKNTSIKLGNLKFKIYNLNNAFETVGKECAITKDCGENTNSLVLYSKINGKNVLLSGDIADYSSALLKLKKNSVIREKNVLKIYDEIMTKNNISKIDLFKAAHHGYYPNNYLEALQKINPVYVVFTNYKDVITGSNSFKKGQENFYKVTKKENLYYSGDGTVIANITSSGKITFSQQKADGCNKFNGC